MKLHIYPGSILNILIMFAWLVTSTSPMFFMSLQAVVGILILNKLVFFFFFGLFDVYYTYENAGTSIKHEYS